MESAISHKEQMTRILQTMMAKFSRQKVAIRLQNISLKATAAKRPHFAHGCSTGRARWLMSSVYEWSGCALCPKCDHAVYSQQKILHCWLMPRPHSSRPALVTGDTCTAHSKCTNQMVTTTQYTMYAWLMFIPLMRFCKIKVQMCHTWTCISLLAQVIPLRNQLHTSKERVKFWLWER